MALVFPGGLVDDKVDHGASTTLGAAMDSGVCTHLAWIKPAALANERHITEKRNRDDTGYKLFRINSGGGDLRVLYDRATTDMNVIASSLVTANEWQFVGYRIDINQTATDQQILRGTLTLPPDFATTYSAQTLGSGAVVSSAGSAFTVGNRVSNGSFDGAIAWVGVWDRYLTLREIREQWIRPRVTQGCVLFTFYGGSEGRGIQRDRSGVNNHGSLVEVAGITIGESPPPVTRVSVRRRISVSLPTTPPSNLKLSDMAFAKGRLPFLRAGRYPVPDSTID